MAQLTLEELKTKFVDGYTLTEEDVHDWLDSFHHKATDLPEGPKGDKGDTGDQGPQGEPGTPASTTLTVSAISGSYELTSADNGKVLQHTGTGTLTKNANFTTGMHVHLAKGDGNTLTIGFTLEAFGTNTGTKLDGFNPSVTLIQKASTVARIGELTI